MKHKPISTEYRMSDSVTNTGKYGQNRGFVTDIAKTLEYYSQDRASTINSRPVTRIPGTVENCTQAIDSHGWFNELERPYLNFLKTSIRKGEQACRPSYYRSSLI
jgi:hypothetical protein